MLWWGSRVSDDSQNASQRENHDHPDDVKPKFPLTQCEKRNLKVLPRKIHYHSERYQLACIEDYMFVSYRIV